MLEWKVVILEARTGAENMATDEFFARRALESQATICFYQWIKSTLSLGYNQDIKKINRDILEGNNADLVRRPTGGSAVLHQRLESDLTYSISIPLDYLNRIREKSEKTFRTVCMGVVYGLKKIGISANLASENDIRVEGRKISGNAALILRKEKNASLLMHGALPFSLENISYMCSTLNLLGEKRQRFIGGIACIRDFVSVDYKTARMHLLNGFFKRLKVTNHSLCNRLTREEEEAVKPLVAKYRSHEFLNKGKSDKGICFDNVGSGEIPEYKS